MMDKITRIINEIQRRIDEWNPESGESTSSARRAVLSTLTSVKNYIERLPEPQHDCATCTNSKGCVACVDGELYEGGAVYADAPTDKTGTPTDTTLDEAAKVCAAAVVLNGMGADATVGQLREVAVKCFESGAKWGSGHTLGEVCKWLERNAGEYIYMEGAPVWSTAKIDADDMLETLKREMEGKI